MNRLIKRLDAISEKSAAIVIPNTPISGLPSSEGRLPDSISGFAPTNIAPGQGLDSGLSSPTTPFGPRETGTSPGLAFGLPGMPGHGPAMPAFGEPKAPMPSTTPGGQPASTPGGIPPASAPGQGPEGGSLPPTTLLPPTTPGGQPAPTPGGIQPTPAPGAEPERKKPKKETPGEEGRREGVEEEGEDEEGYGSYLYSGFYPYPAYPYPAYPYPAYPYPAYPYPGFHIPVYPYQPHPAYHGSRQTPFTYVYAKNPQGGFTFAVNAGDRTIRGTAKNMEDLMNQVLKIASRYARPPRSGQPAYPGFWPVYPV